VIRGANRAPEEFEASLEGIAGLRSGCAVAAGFVPEGGDGEELLILAERARSPRVAAAELEEAVRGAVLERTGVRPHSVELLAPGTLPRTSSGKMRRGEALRRYLAGALDAPGRVGGLALLREMARSALAQARAGRRPGL
jgi:acyl-CoA synthetase (AMP-forming)/AMP-acid ligase II